MGQNIVHESFLLYLHIPVLIGQFSLLLQKLGELSLQLLYGRRLVIVDKQSMPGRI